MFRRLRVLPTVAFLRCHSTISEPPAKAIPYETVKAMDASLDQRLDETHHQNYSPVRISVRKGGKYLCLFWKDPDQVKQEEEAGVISVGGPSQTQFLAEFLRVISPSADVKGSPDIVCYGKRGVVIKDVYPVGRYAVRIQFSDEHDAGIYPYKYLYEMGECKFQQMRQYIQRVRSAKKSRNAPVKRERKHVPPGNTRL